MILLKNSFKKVLPLIFLGASFGYFIWEIQNWNFLTLFFSENKIPKESFRSLIQLIGLCWLLLTIIIFWIRQQKPKRFCQLLSRIIFWEPLLLAGLLPMLFHKTLWRNEPLLSPLLLILFCIILFLFLSKNQSEKGKNILREYPTSTPIAYSVILGILIISYTIYFSYYTIIHHYLLKSAAHDLDLVRNALWNTLHGHFFYSSYFQKSLFSVHFFPIHLLWFPFYSILPRPEILLIGQSLIIALAAIPLFYVAQEKLKSYWLSLVIVISFLLYPAQHGANFYDVHELAFFSPLLFSSTYFFLTEKKYGYWLSLILLLFVKEDIALVLLPYYLSLAFKTEGFKRKLALISGLICIFYYPLAQKIITILGGVDSSDFFLGYYQSLMAPNLKGASSLLFTIITNPVYILNHLFSVDRILYFLQMTLPLAMLPLFLKKNIPWYIYGFGITLLADRPALHQISFQYIWYLTPLLFLGLIETLKRFQESKTFNPLIVCLLVCTFITSWQYGAVLNREYFEGGFTRVNFNYTKNDKDKLQQLNGLIKLIPKNASITAGETICPHLIEFSDVQTFRGYHQKSDYLLLYFPNFENVTLYNELIQTNQYHIVKIQSGFQLLLRNQ